MTVAAFDEYVADFTEEPGFLNFARIAPIGRKVRAEESAQSALLARARFGTIDSLGDQDLRLREAVGELIGFPPDQVVFQPNTGTGLMHVMFGITGGVALSPAEFPAVTFAVERAETALHSLSPVWLETDHGRVTPGNIRDQLSSSVVAVAVSLVDFRTGFLADLEGIRQVIGDRLLIVDAAQGFAAVDAPFEVADVVVAPGHKWTRAGAGTGFLALSERAVEHLTPVFSGFVGTDADGMPMDEVLPPARSARAFQISYPDPVAETRLAAAVEAVNSVGIKAINDSIASKVTAIIDLADEFGIPVTSPRAESERAGIVVIEPANGQLTVFAASLHNHGVSVTVRDGSVRLSAHVSTDDETLAMLRASFISFTAAVEP